MAAVADSTDYLAVRSHEHLTDVSRDVLTVQHRLSGLRATFFWDNGETIGRVLAKSYSIPSIDPDRTWEGEGLQAVREWQGTGITSRIYQHGAALEPNIRWRAAPLTNQSARMRRRLHQIDPWRFEASTNPDQHPHDACLWCIEHDWAQLEQAEFTSHPTRS